MPAQLLDLPANVLEQIFGCFSFEQLSKLRETNQTFNKMCKEMLNSGFRRAENRLSISLQRVKSQLPRRESERKNHALARHADTFSAVETRLSLLSMTFRKYIETGGCCFFAGKVIDELMNVQRQVNHSVESVLVGRKTEQLKPHEILQELRDISSMAMEYFEEQIVPMIKKRNPQAMRNAAAYMCYEFPTSYCYSSPASSSQPSTSAAATANEEMDSLTLFGDVIRLRKEVRHLNSSVSKYKAELQKVQTEYKAVLGQKRKLEDQSRELQEINKRLVAHDNKFNEICSELRSALSERHGQGIGATVVLDIAAAPILPQPATVNTDVAPVPGPPPAKKSRIRKSSNGSIAKNVDEISAVMQLRRSRRLSEKSTSAAADDDSKFAANGLKLEPIIEEKSTWMANGRKLEPIIEEERAPGKRRRLRLGQESDEDATVAGFCRKRERK